MFGNASLENVSALQLQQISKRSRSLPSGVRIYAVGDIHGRADLLDKLLLRINADFAERPTIRPVYVFLGDYVDRGPSSRQTIDRLIEHGATHEAIFLKGNHEWLALKGLSDPVLFEEWMRLGGLETLLSYRAISPGYVREGFVAEMQAKFHQVLSQAHLRFFRNLQNSFTCGDFFFAHAGVRPHVELAQQKEKDLLWIRGEFLLSDQDFGKIVVHGHTPVSNVDVKPNRINIDTGAYSTGCLTCLAIDNDSWTVIDTRD